MRVFWEPICGRTESQWYGFGRPNNQGIRSRVLRAVWLRFCGREDGWLHELDWLLQHMLTDGWAKHRETGQKAAPTKTVKRATSNEVASRQCTTCHVICTHLDCGEGQGPAYPSSHLKWSFWGHCGGGPPVVFLRGGGGCSEVVGIFATVEWMSSIDFHVIIHSPG